MKKQSIITSILLLIAISLLGQSTPENELKIGRSLMPSCAPLSTSSPLIVIDSVADEDFSIDQLNPNEIFSVDVLKDKIPSFYTSNYPEKVKYGVIVITTKTAFARGWLMKHAIYNRKCKKLAEDVSFDYSNCQLYTNGVGVPLTRETISQIETKGISKIKIKHTDKYLINVVTK